MADITEGAIRYVVCCPGIVAFLRYAFCKLYTATGSVEYIPHVTETGSLVEKNKNVSLPSRSSGINSPGSKTVAEIRNPKGDNKAACVEISSNVITDNIFEKESKHVFFCVTVINSVRVIICQYYNRPNAC